MDVHHPEEAAKEEEDPEGEVVAAEAAVGDRAVGEDIMPAVAPGDRAVIVKRRNTMMAGLDILRALPPRP